MDILKFTLSGKTAFFKKPDVNTYYYFTFGTIHKVALLGILGAISGYKGYNQQLHSENQVFPEFYEKFKDIKIGIDIQNNQGYIPKKMQTFNNSVGYASKEQGGNLIVKEQWLEEPKWDIYILLQGEIEKDIADRIINSKFTYIPYLGKNDHIANITDVKLIRDVNKTNEMNHVDSLFIKEDFTFVEQEIDLDDIEEEYTAIYKYEEMLPISLEETTNKYNLETFVATNAPVTPTKECLLYKCEDKIIYFF